MSGLSSAADSKTGAKLRQGPHQEAQKSTRTMPSPVTVVSKLSLVSSIVLMVEPTVATLRVFPGVASLGGPRPGPGPFGTVGATHGGCARRSTHVDSPHEHRVPPGRVAAADRSHRLRRTGGAGAGDTDACRRARPGRRLPRVAIIGAGAAGLCMAIRLADAGIESFTIYEKSSGVGGTWQDSTYPQAACDVPSHLYSFSFASKRDWTRRFARQPEILGYFESLVDRFDLEPHLRFDVEVTEAHYDDAAGTWTLHMAEGDGGDGDTVVADVVVSGLGQLNRPHIPDHGVGRLRRPGRDRVPLGPLGPRPRPLR